MAPCLLPMGEKSLRGQIEGPCNLALGPGARDLGLEAAVASHTRPDSKVIKFGAWFACCWLLVGWILLMGKPPSAAIARSERKDEGLGERSRLRSDGYRIRFQGSLRGYGLALLPCWGCVFSDESC